MIDCEKCRYYHDNCDAKFRCRIDAEKIRADAIDEIENNMSVHQVGLSGYYYISFDEWEQLKEQKM